VRIAQAMEAEMGFEAKEFGERLIRHMPDAVIYADAKGMVRYWNRGAERIFGFPEDEAVGQSLDIIIPPSLRERHWTGFDHTLKTGETRYGAGDLLSVPALRKDGSRISVEFTIVPFHDAVGRIAGIAAVMRDVTARFEEMRALRRQAAARGAGSSAPP
jgi:PAS domain S-box-containing protein